MGNAASPLIITLSHLSDRRESVQIKESRLWFSESRWATSLAASPSTTRPFRRRRKTGRSAIWEGTCTRILLGQLEFMIRVSRKTTEKQQLRVRREWKNITRSGKDHQKPTNTENFSCIARLIPVWCLWKEKFLYLFVVFVLIWIRMFYSSQMPVLEKEIRKRDMWDEFVQAQRR